MPRATPAKGLTLGSVGDGTFLEIMHAPKDKNGELKVAGATLISYDRHGKWAETDGAKCDFKDASGTVFATIEHGPDGKSYASASKGISVMKDANGTLLFTIKPVKPNSEKEGMGWFHGIGLFPAGTDEPSLTLKSLYTQLEGAAFNTLGTAPMAVVNEMDENVATVGPFAKKITTAEGFDAVLVVALALVKQDYFMCSAANVSG